MQVNSTQERLQQLLPQLFQPVEVSGDLYLRFHLTREIPALLSMDRVQEALLVAGSVISPIPNMPEFTIGMMSTRDRVFSVVDLSQVLGLVPLPLNMQNYQVVIINVDQQTKNSISLGLAVHRLGGVTRFKKETLRPMTREVPKCLQPYQLGCFLVDEEEVLVLDPVAIANTPSLLTNPYL